MSGHPALTRKHPDHTARRCCDADSFPSENRHRARPRITRPKLLFKLRHGQFASTLFAPYPDLVQKITVAIMVKHQLSALCDAIALSCVGIDEHAVRSTTEKKQSAGMLGVCNLVFASWQLNVPGAEVERNIGLHCASYLYRK